MSYEAKSELINKIWLNIPQEEQERILKSEAYLIGELEEMYEGIKQG